MMHFLDSFYLSLVGSMLNAASPEDRKPYLSADTFEVV
jgi:hypothetical protein